MKKQLGKLEKNGAKWKLIYNSVNSIQQHINIAH